MTRMAISHASMLTNDPILVELNGSKLSSTLRLEIRINYLPKNLPDKRDPKYSINALDC